MTTTGTSTREKFDRQSAKRASSTHRFGGKSLISQFKVPKDSRPTELGKY